MKLPILFSLLLVTAMVFAQPARVSKRWLSEQDNTRQAKVLETGTPTGSSLDRGVSLHVMPLSFVNIFSRFRLGAQLKRARWSYLLDLEIGNDLTHQLGSEQEDKDFNFYGIRPELRYGLGAADEGFYAGLELPVTIMNRTTSGSFITAQGNRLRVEETRQDRFRASAIAKLGVQFLAFDHVLFDCYLGLGPVYREVRYTERVGETPDTLDEFEEGFFIKLAQEGSRWLPELAAGVRVGWWF